MADEKRLPWMKWYARDWRGDGALRGCSFAARGLWADILTVIHDEGEPYGHLRINGSVPDSARLGRMLGGSAKEIDRLLAELESAGVFDRGPDAAIISRRMVRDKERAEANQRFGLDGGNPNIRRGIVPKEDRIRRFRRSDNPAKTQRIFNKSQGKCHWCSVPLMFEWNGAGDMPTNLFHVDHVMPIKDGGDNEEDNLVAACAPCNHQRKNDADDPNGGVTVGRASDHKAQNPEPNPIPREEQKNISSFVVGRGKRGGDSVTIEDPNERIARFQKTIAQALGRNGWTIVAAAADPTSPDYDQALDACKAAAKRLGKGWPHLWPAPQHRGAA